MRERLLLSFRMHDSKTRVPGAAAALRGKRRPPGTALPIGCREPHRPHAPGTSRRRGCSGQTPDRSPEALSDTGADSWGMVDVLLWSPTARKAFRFPNPAQIQKAGYAGPSRYIPRNHSSTQRCPAPHALRSGTYLS